MAAELQISSKKKLDRWVQNIKGSLGRVVPAVGDRAGRALLGQVRREITLRSKNPTGRLGASFEAIVTPGGRRRSTVTVRSDSPYHAVQNRGTAYSGPRRFLGRDGWTTIRDGRTVIIPGKHYLEAAMRNSVTRMQNILSTEVKVARDRARRGL
jgi:hypothetical protein